jgi:hypothetical protein
MSNQCDGCMRGLPQAPMFSPLAGRPSMNGTSEPVTLPTTEGQRVAAWLQGHVWRTAMTLSSHELQYFKLQPRPHQPIVRTDTP